METDTKAQSKEQNSMKRTSSSNSDSQPHLNSTHSPQRFHSPLQSEPPDTPPFASPVGSPEKPSPSGSPEMPPLEKPPLFGSPDNLSPLGSPDNPSLVGSPVNSSPFGSAEKPSPFGSTEKPWPSGSPQNPPPSGSPEKPLPIDDSKAIVAVNNATQFSPSPSPSPPHSLEDTADAEKTKSPLENTSAMGEAKYSQKYTVEDAETKSPPYNTAAADEEKSPSPMVLFNCSVKEEVSQMTTKKMRASSRNGGGGSGAVAAILQRTRRVELLKLAALGFRLSEVVLSLISFSVMAADNTQGWSGDSYDRYKEYRYCLSVNVIAFVYSGFQACDLAYYLVKEKHLIHHHLRSPFDFFMDQILAYLLISASSAAATRVDDWVSNWGKDQFTVMASASVAMSFMVFLAFAFSSLISGYNLFTRESM